MKIALLSSSYHPYYRGGGEYSVKLLAENLHRMGHEVRVVTAFDRNQTDIVEGITVHRIKHPNIYWSYHSSEKTDRQKLLWHLLEAYNPQVSASLSPLLTEYQPDVVHIRNVEDFSPYAARVAHQHGIPVVVTLNSFTWLCPKATMFRNGSNCQNQCRDCRLMTYPKKLLSRYIDAVVGVSKYMIDTHRQAGYFPRAATSVIYTSGPAQVTPPRDPNSAVRFGYIGRIHSTKGVYEVIKAFLSLTVGPELFIAGEGDGDYLRQCQQLAEESKRVHFLGKTVASEFYRQVDVVMVSSLWNEPFPRVLVEAYAYGKPVIASRTGGTAEKVVHQQTGFLFDPSDREAMAEQMRAFTQLSASQRVAMQQAVGAYLQEAFPDESQQYWQLYQSLIQ